MSIVTDAQFIRSVADWRDLPPDRGTEVAFVGRSNAGKSTAINAIVGRKIAFVSKTPGRTQTINFFSCGPHRRLVDLPGYGYAAVALAERERWATLISTYLQERLSLFGVVLIMDARHPLTVRDRQLLAWFAPSGKALHVLLTKADKITRQQAHTALCTVTRDVGALVASATVQLFSGVSGMGVPAAQKLLAAWLNKKPPVKGE